MDHPHQFALGVLDLVMQATQHAFLGARMVVLDERHVDAGHLREVAGVEALKEKTTLIGEHLGFDDQDVGYRGCNDIHGNSLASLPRY
ncbi:hypothetical protein D3C79_714730 [compost metagenome]